MKDANGVRWLCGALLLCALLCVAWSAPDARPTLGEGDAQVNWFAVEAETTLPPWETPAPEGDGGASGSDQKESPDRAFELTVVAPVGAEAQTPKRVLIYHTHTYEAYEPDAQAPYVQTERWRTADERYNVVRVGRELAALLTALGAEVVHDTAAYEPPVLSSAYTRSLTMLEARMAAGERYDLCIDLHRDAYAPGQSADNAVGVGDQNVARVMLLVGKGAGQTGEGFDKAPDWESNLTLAQGVTDALNAQLRGLCRDVRVKSGRFNQHVSDACLLVEVGNNRNTLPEALAAMPYLADALWQVLRGME